MREQIRNLVYRKAKAADIDLLTKTRIEVLLAANSLPDDTDMSEVEKQSRAYYEQAIPGGTHTAFLAFDADQFVGAGGISYYQVMPTFHNPTGRKGYIMNMYTRPEYRRMGIAHHMLDLLVQDAGEKGVTFISLEATAAGRPLYEKYGFSAMTGEMELRRSGSEGRVLFTVYTKPIDPVEYPAGLACSVHFSFRRPGQEAQPLNRDYGILFAKGTVSREDTIIPVGIRDPGLFILEDGRIGICGKMVTEDGEPFACEKGNVFLWKTRDLIRFEEVGPVSEAELSGYTVSDTLAVSPDIAEEAIRWWTPVRQENVLLPEQVTVTSEKELEQIQATVVYSDGSRAVRKVDWNTDGIDFDRSGTYPVEGTIRQQKFPFPLARGYGDPVIFPWDGKWYFLGTNDNLDDIGMYVREADSVEGLFSPEIVEHLILPYDPERGFEQTFWAPEFHRIGGDAYILFAVSGHVWGPQCHMMKLKKGGRIICAEDWENPVPVVRMDGTPLSADGITLDMTYIRAGSGSYMVWSYRRHIGTPRDTGSMLYIASVGEAEPWRLTSEPVLLSRPLYGWENVAGTINNEGPYALVRGGKVYLTYSGGSANAYTYALGLLTADGEDDLTDPGAWTKSIAPVLTFRSVAGEYGPGHNSFFVNDLGETMIAYHAETGIHEHLRCDGIRRVHFRKDGTPYFQMSAEEDLCRRKLTMKIHRE